MAISPLATVFAIACAQFSNRGRETAMSRGNPGGAPVTDAAAERGRPSAFKPAAVPASAAPEAIKRRA
jgi:hypothetical protein